MDKEKAIKGLHQHCEGSMFDRCGECPYYDVADEPFICRDMLLNDLNELQKEQESIIESLKSDLHETLEVVSGRLNVIRCRKCDKSCLEEGKINGFWCCKRKEWHDGDWYCADGKLKG